MVLIRNHLLLLLIKHYLVLILVVKNLQKVMWIF